MLFQLIFVVSLFWGQHTAMPDDGLVLLKGGAFSMGCTGEQQDCDDDEKPAHTVTVSDFYIGRYEVTQKLWQEVMGSNPSFFHHCDQCPVEQVSWNDVQLFLKRYNALHPGRHYRLPTEAEWEYAARNGKMTLFANGKNTADPKDLNFNSSAYAKKPYSLEGVYRQQTLPVGTLNSPNARGLHDMSGNVYEWCADRYDPAYYRQSPALNPAGPRSGDKRILRGGSWNYPPQYCRVADRGFYAPDARYHFVGFRLARSK